MIMDDNRVQPCLKNLSHHSVNLQLLIHFRSIVLLLYL